MNIIEKDIKDIKPYKNNPRINNETVKYVAESIKEFGFKVPIVIDKNNEIVTGHTRLKASKKLGLTKVPCIIADDLTEEQIKAFRLADNKVSEKSEWDFELLKEELSDIIDIDMTLFDFEMFEQEEQEEEYKPNERERTNNSYNLELYDSLKVDGFYQMPIIKNDGFIPDDLIGFNYMLNSKDKNIGIHCFVDDYQFERLWNDPYKYVDKILEYDCILSPDFSLYMDMPMAMKIWNVYRSRMIGQFLQNRGVKVIPTISWAEPETFNFCFDGIPKGSIVAISTIGVKKDEISFSIWKTGVDEMIKRIEPSMILCYGGKVDYDFGRTKVKYYDNKVTENMREIETERE